MKKPIEFWVSGIDFDTYELGADSVATAFLTCKHSGHREAIHMREVIPGTVVISREDLRAAWIEASRYGHLHPERRLEAILFGPTEQGEK